MQLQGVDLGEQALIEVLSELAIWDGAARSVVVAEGVLMYLGLAEVETFLTAVRSATSPGSRLLLTYIREEELNRIFQGWLGTTLKYSLNWVGEPYRWGVTGEGIEPFLVAHGFGTLGNKSRYDLKERYLAPVNMADQPLSRLERVVAVEPT